MKTIGRKQWGVIVGGVLYAGLAALGWQAEQHAETVWREVGVAMLLLSAPMMLLLTVLLRLSERRAETPKVSTKPFSMWKAFGFIGLCYVPMFLLTFPGSFAYDVPFQLEQVATGQYSTHHPLLHTLLLGGCVQLGERLGWINGGAALYTLIQMIGLSGCFAETSSSIARQAGNRVARWSVVFFALYPLHMVMAVNATKDVLFSGLFVLTLAWIRECVVLETFDAKRGIAITLAGAGMLMLRNNALYALVVWGIGMALMLKKSERRVLIAVLGAVVLSMGAGRVLTTITHAQKGDAREMLSWPIQQMARARMLYGDQLNEEERAMVDQLMPNESWRLYEPSISDPVKFEFDTQVLTEDWGQALRVYLSMGAKCPQAYADAVLKLTYASWYPYRAYKVAGYYVQMGITDQYYEWCLGERITSQSLAPRVLASLSWRFGAQGAMQIPIVGWLFNMGLISWVMLYAVIREAYEGRWKCFACALLPVLLWGTFLLGPVMAGRYAYPIVCTLPVLLAQNNRKA